MVNGGTRHTTDPHPWLAVGKVIWWLLAQPCVAAGVVVIVAMRAAGAPAVAALAVALIVGLGLAAATVHRRRLGMAARLRRAMVEVGLVHREPGCPPIEPWRRGRAVRDGRNVVLRWEMPPGTTARRVAEHLEELEQRCGVGLVCWFDRDRLHTEVLRHRLPDHVEFAEFYARQRPGGDLIVGLGRSRRGALWCDLARLPHLLVGGMSGGGKSVFLRQLLTWLILAHQPSSLRLLLLDFKSGVELMRFGKLPHSLHDAVTDPEDAEFALRDVVAEIDRRMTALAQAQVVDLDGWEAAGRPAMPRWVVVCDELARLTVGNAGESKEQRGTRERTTALLCDVARMGRAAGVHLVVCTQRPDADAVPGQLKANLAGTVAFRVRNEANSRILLDCDRAALLPCHQGRAIWQDHQMEEFQAIHVGSDECFRLIEERWLREVGAFEETGGIRRWRPSTAKSGVARWVESIPRALVSGWVDARSAAVGRCTRVVAAIHARGAVAAAPAAAAGDGAAARWTITHDGGRASTTSPVATPLATMMDDRDATREVLADERCGDREESGGPRVTQGRQSTEECPSRLEEEE
jgi:hypothetical protein